MKTNTCLIVRNQVKAQALSCLDPRETEMGFRINTLVTWRGISISGSWLESRGISLFFDGDSLFFDGEMYRAWKGRVLVFEEECPPTSAQLIPLLEEADKVLLFHSIACQALRLSRRARRSAAMLPTARSATEAAAGAAIAARDAWATAEAARDAWATAGAARRFLRTLARLRKQVEVDEQCYKEREERE